MSDRILLFCVFLFFSQAYFALAQPTEADYKRTIQIAISEAQKQHLHKPTIDEAFCLRWFNEYVNSLDPRRLYFLDSDINEFRDLVDRLPELAITGNPDFYRLVTDRYQERVESALTHILDQLDGTMDFSTDEEIVLRHDGWSKSPGDRKKRWRLQLTYDLLIEKSNGSVIEDAKSFLKSRYESICEQANEITEEHAVGIYLDSYCSAINPQSGYFTQSEFESFSGGPIKEYSIGLSIKYRKGRATIWNVGSGFRREPAAESILGCELLAIRDQSGSLLNVREIFPATFYRTVKYEMKADDWVTLELYDEARLRRFSVKWPRKEDITTR